MWDSKEYIIKMNIVNTLFLSGHEYYTSIKTKSQEHQKWYETLYIYYYENFKIILLILACIILYNFISIHHNKLPHTGCHGKATLLFSASSKKQKGGFNFASGVKGVAGRITSSTTLSKTDKNIGKTKSALSVPFKKETYKKLGSSISTGVKTGYERSKELGSAGIAYGTNQIRENSEFIYKYIAIIFIGIGFSVYIFPVLAMFLIGAVTFLIVRKSIADVITM